MQECFPKHSRMGTAMMKYDTETKEEGIREAGTKEKRSPDSPNYSSVLQSPPGVSTPEAMDELRNKPAPINHVLPHAWGH